MAFERAKRQRVSIYMRTFGFNKLVRDKVVSGIIEAGNKPVYYRLNKRRYLSELKKKLLEETQELMEAKPGYLAGEVADLQEILDFIKRELNITPKQLKVLQKKKVIRAGSFKEKYYVESVTTRDRSPWIKYYLKHPQKYPEIK